MVVVAVKLQSQLPQLTVAAKLLRSPIVVAKPLLQAVVASQVVSRAYLSESLDRYLAIAVADQLVKSWHQLSKSLAVVLLNQQ